MFLEHGSFRPCSLGGECVFPCPLEFGWYAPLAILKVILCISSKRSELWGLHNFHLPHSVKCSTTELHPCHSTCPKNCQGVSNDLMHVAIALAVSRTCYYFPTFLSLCLVREVTSVTPSFTVYCEAEAISNSQCAKPPAKVRREGSKNQITSLAMYHWGKGLQSIKKKPKPLHPNISIFDVFPMHSFICEHHIRPISYSVLLIMLSQILSFLVFLGSLQFFLLVPSNDTPPFIRLLLQCCMTIFCHILTLVTAALSIFTDRTAFFFFWTISLEWPQEWDCWIIGCECIRSPFFVSVVGIPVCTAVKFVSSTQHRRLNQEFYFYQAFWV